MNVKNLHLSLEFDLPGNSSYNDYHGQSPVQDPRACWDAKTSLMSSTFFIAAWQWIRGLHMSSFTAFCFVSHEKSWEFYKVRQSDIWIFDQTVFSSLQCPAEEAKSKPAMICSSKGVRWNSLWRAEILGCPHSSLGHGTSELTKVDYFTVIKHVFVGLLGTLFFYPQNSSTQHQPWHVLNFRRLLDLLSEQSAKCGKVR